MPLGRAVSDFTAIARLSLHEAIADDLSSWDPPIFGNASPQQVFIGRLSKDSNLRRAADAARVNQPKGKDLLRRISCAGIDRQARTFALAFFVLRHNFCRLGTDGRSTPATLHGVAERPWTPRDVAALVFESDPPRASA